MEDDLATIFERIRKVTVTQLVDIKEEEITPSSNFVDDLGADSLDLVEFIMALEEEFTTPERKIGIPDEDAEKILTVQDAMDYIRDKGVTDNELSKAEAKAAPKPTPRPVIPARPEQHRPAQARPSQSPRPNNPQAKPGQSQPSGNRPRGQRPPQHHGQQQQQRHQSQPQKPPSGQQPS